MDKKLNRTILYKRPIQTKVIQEIKPKPKTEIKPPESIKKINSIKKWFDEHNLISINGLCKIANLDTSNFKKQLNSPKGLSEDKIKAILPIIKTYGYVE